MKKKILLCLLLISSLCSCSGNDISINISSQRDSSPKNSSTDVLERKIENSIGEKFYCDAFVSSGTLYATVTGAECYNNINDANAKLDGFFSEMSELSNKINIDTGDVLPDKDGNKQVFMVVHITMENVDAVSRCNELIYVAKSIDPDFFGDKERYCEDYDFSARYFGISLYPGGDASNPNIGGLGVDYFSQKGKLYSDFHRTELFSVKPGESVSFDLGTFIYETAGNEELAKYAGVETGDSIFSKYILNTSNSRYDSYVKLEMK